MMNNISDDINYFINNHKRTFVLLFGLSLSLLCLKGEFDSWKATLWLFNYDIEFIKRGLIGTVLQFFDHDAFVRFDIIFYSARIVFFSLVFCCCLFFSRFFNHQPISFFLMLLLSGFCIQQFSLELGRLDQINYIFLFLLLLIGDIWKSTWFILFSTITLCLMMLITETAILVQIPVFFFFIFQQVQRRIYSYRHFIIMCLVVGCALVLTTLMGNLTSISFSQWYAHLSNISAFEVNSYSAKFMDRSFTDNVVYTIERWQNPKTLSRSLLVFLVSTPYLWLIFSTLKQTSKAISNFIWWIVLIPSLCSLPLFLLGIDFFRWYAYMFLNFFIVLAIFYKANDIKILLNYSRLTIFLCLLFSLYSGPWGASLALPERMQLLKWHGIEGRF